MAFIHGSKTIVKVNAIDLTTFTKTSTFERSADISDVTGGGADSHAYFGGLLDGTFTMGGTYDSGTGGPHKTLVPLIGVSTALIRQPEGAGTGKPQESCSVVLKKYTETNPVADMITWSADFNVSGTVTESSQA